MPRTSQKDRDRSRAWYLAHRDECSEKWRNGYYSMSPLEIEELKTYRREYYLLNREKILARSQARYAAKGTEVRQKAKDRYLSDYVGFILDRSKQRAKRIGVPWALTRNDILIPDKCPVFGIKLTRAVYGSGRATANSPSLDRIIPKLGYIPGNVQIISYKANCMKSNATPSELVTFAKWILEKESK